MKDLNKITEEMATYVCDKLCQYPLICEQDELDSICAECKMGEFVNQINEQGKTNLERLTTDEIATMIYNTDTFDKVCDGDFDENDNAICHKGSVNEQNCIECIKEWLLREDNA